MQLSCADNSFDVVVAGNVIHLLDEPQKALAELFRVCRNGGKVIIPTYLINEANRFQRTLLKVYEIFGAGFKTKFSYDEYRRFFANAGYAAEYILIEGKFPCAIAVIKK